MRKLLFFILITQMDIFLSRWSILFNLVRGRLQNQTFCVFFHWRSSSLTIKPLKRIWLLLPNIWKAVRWIKNLFGWAVCFSSFFNFFASLWWPWSWVFINLGVKTIWMFRLRKKWFRLYFLYLRDLRMKCYWSHCYLDIEHVLLTVRRIKRAMRRWIKRC